METKLKMLKKYLKNSIKPIKNYGIMVLFFLFIFTYY